MKESELKGLVESGILPRTAIMGARRGFRVVLSFGEKKDLMLETSRGDVRQFASLDTAASYVADLGVPRFEVDMTNYEPGRLRKPRPDRAEALRRTRTAMQQQPLVL